MKFFDSHSPKGHLEIWKYFNDGTAELHFSDSNVICSGMGVTLSEMFQAPRDVSVEPFQIKYFQVGKGGVSALQVSSTGDLGTALTEAEYGSGYLDLDSHTLTASAQDFASEIFGKIPDNYIKQVSDRKVMWQIVLDEQTANIGDGEIGVDAEALNEIGLFSKNPTRTATEKSYLCAYRFFKPVYKTDSFILVFRWTIEF